MLRSFQSPTTCCVSSPYGLAMRRSFYPLPHQVKRVKSYMSDSKFNYDELLGISRAGAGLFKWVAAMVNYYNVAKTVEPKRKKVADSERSLRTAQRELAAIKDELAALNAELGRLRTLFSEKTSEQKELKDKADVMERRLVAASRLIAGLGSERMRWTSDLAELGERKERLLGDCLLTGAFLSYTGGVGLRCGVGTIPVGAG